MELHISLFKPKLYDEGHFIKFKIKIFKKSWKNHSFTLFKNTSNSQIHVYTNNMRIHDPLYILLYVHDISLLCGYGGLKVLPVVIIV